MKRVLSVCMVMAAASSVQAASLVSVGVLDAENPFSEVRAVSAEGTYVAGGSTALVVINSSTGETALRTTPFLWSASTGSIELPNPSGNHSVAFGVSVGIGSNAGNIILAGLHEGFLANRYYKAPLSSPASGVWADSGSAAGLGAANLRGGTSNNLRSDSFNGDGRWYTAGVSDNRAARLRGDPFIGWNGETVKSINSVSAAGVVVGTANTVPREALWEKPGGEKVFGYVPGAGGVNTEGFGISPSFGISETEDFAVQWICGQNVSLVVDGFEDLQPQAFRWNRADASMELLGTLPGHTSSVAYTVADNGITAGRSFVAEGETAVVWDTTGNWDNTGTAQSLQTLLEDLGVDTSAWTRLVRIYAASDDGSVLAGYGIWAADGSTRGFVASLEDIGPVAGACCVNTGLGTGTCSILTQAECESIPHGTYLGDSVPCGQDNANCGDFCPVPFADANLDGSVDHTDFAWFQACYSDMGGGVPMGCECFDRNGDGAITLDDFGNPASPQPNTFAGCYSGPAIPADPDCEIVTP